MSQPFTVSDSRRAETLRGFSAQTDVVPPPRGDHDIDRNATRWVLAATVAFWLVVFAAGRSFLF